MRSPSVRLTLAASAALTLGLAALAERQAEACGCLSPPEPIDGADYAVNQQSEQIIFEVEDGHVTAHVSIRYAGRPESFAWIVPVPAAPELSLSSAAAFGLLDRATAPTVSVTSSDLCPEPAYHCRYHDWPICESDGDDNGGGGGDPGGAQDGGAGGEPPGEPPVEVVDRQTVGSYDTLVFAAGDTDAAVEWLRSEGFLVNETMAPFMQPYADAGMLFVASKLVPGADVSEIQPLKMRFPAEAPMIPLQLTAVAAEPHLTVTAFVYGERFVRPEGLPVVELDPGALSQDRDGRVNYPMLLSRALDEVGGRGFVVEYMDGPVVPDFDQGTGCCTSDWDRCNIQNDGVCSCPRSPFDAQDCSDAVDLREGVQLVDDLAARHMRLTRLTTRLSPEEMTFDPAFTPLPASTPRTGRLSLQGSTGSLAACEGQILEPSRYQAILDQQECASVYCGTGECVITNQGASCDCDEGSVARLFTDLDGLPSVTCAPSTSPVDHSAGGAELPSACDGVSCGAGTCVDVGGFPTCACDDGHAAAAAGGGLVASCRPITARTGTSGARDYTEPLEELPVCAPEPPTCGDFGWLERRAVARPGVQCESSHPDAADLERPDAPTCADLGLRDPGGCGGCDAAADPRAALGSLALLGLTGLVAFGRRRRRSTR